MGGFWGDQMVFREDGGETSHRQQSIKGGTLEN